MIRFDRVTVTYDGAPTPALADVDLEIPEGELCLAVGPTGSGKSTLLRAVNGLVPRFSGGHLAGTVSVDGRSTATYPPRDLADAQIRRRTADPGITPVSSLDLNHG